MSNRGGRPKKDAVEFDFSGHSAPKDYTADHGIYISTDGRREAHEMLHPRKHRRVCPSTLDDYLADWTPVVEEDNPAAYYASNAFPDNVSDGTRPVETVVEVQLEEEKRKRYLSSVRI